MHVKRPQNFTLVVFSDVINRFKQDTKENDIVIRRKQKDVLLYIQNYLKCVNDDYDSD